MLFVIGHCAGASNYTAFISAPGDTAQRSLTAAINTCEAGIQPAGIGVLAVPYSIGQGTESALSASDPSGLLGEIPRLLIVWGDAHRAGRSKAGRSIICSEN